MKERNIALCIVLSVITCGIYGIYWFVLLTDEVKEVSGDDKSASGGMAFLFTLISCGIYGIYWAYKRGENIDEAKRQRGMEGGNTAIVYLLLSIFGFGIIAYALMQNELNKMAA